MILFTGTDPITGISFVTYIKKQHAAYKTGLTLQYFVCQEASRAIKGPSRLNSCGVWLSDWLSGSVWCNGSRRIDLFSIYVSGKRKTSFNLDWRFWVGQSNISISDSHKPKLWRCITLSSNCIQSPLEIICIHLFPAGMQMFNVVASKVWQKYERFFEWIGIMFQTSFNWIVSFK